MAKSKFYSVNYEGWPAVKITEYEDQDSYHWQNRANDMRHWLELKMGEQVFLDWVNRLFPGGDASQATWKEIFDLYEVKFRVVQGEERDAEECSCKPDLPDGRCFPLCPACKADIDRKLGNEIPIGGLK